MSQVRRQSMQLPGILKGHRAAQPDHQPHFIHATGLLESPAERVPYPYDTIFDLRSPYLRHPL